MIKFLKLLLCIIRVRNSVAIVKGWRRKEHRHLVKYFWLCCYALNAMKKLLGWKIGEQINSVKEELLVGGCLDTGKRVEGGLMPSAVE